MASIWKLSRAEKQKKAEQGKTKPAQEKTKPAQEKKRPAKVKNKQKIEDFFEYEMHHSHYKWQIRDDQRRLHANCSNLQKIINQPRLHNITHILVLGLSYPEQIEHDRWLDNEEQELFFKRLAVVYRLRKILFPKDGPVDVENANLKFSRATILGLEHLKMKVVNHSYGGFSLASDHSLVYDVRRKQGDLFAHMKSNSQLPAAVLTDFPSLLPSSYDDKNKKIAFSEILEKYDLVSLMGTLHHAPQAKENDLKKENIPFVRVRGAHPAKIEAEMAEMETQLTRKAYTAVQKGSKEARTYTSEPEMILLIRKGLPYFDKRDVPKFPLALYHKDDPVKLTPSDFH